MSEYPIDGIEIDEIGGNCPVQAEGRIDGQPFYFRARGDRWSLGIGGTDPVAAPGWHYEETYPGGPFSAGWMELEEARGFIARAAWLWRSGHPGVAPGSALATMVQK